MTPSQSASYFDVSDELLEEIAGRVLAAVQREVPQYGRIVDPEVIRDVREVVRLNVATYLRVLVEDRALRTDELTRLEQAARRRVNQAIQLDAVLQSYRVGVRVMWQAVLDLARQEDHGRLAMLTLQYSDRTTEATAHAYVEERQRHLRSQQDAARALLTRAILGEVSDETVTGRDAALLGLDFSRPHAIVTAVSIRHPGRRDSAQVDLVLARMAGTIDRQVPGSVTTLVSSGLVAVVSPEAVPAVEAVLERTLPADRRFARFRVGVGTGWTGVSGLHASHQEAGRAITLGGLLHPDHLIHRYRELRLFDLFKSGDAADRFVQELLGAVLALDQRRRQRALETLRGLFDNAHNRKRTAHQLGVHQNTLTHRLNALEELLGGRLDSGEFCFRLQLALHLLPLVRETTRDSETSTMSEAPEPAD